jgi:hypothetical protein
VSLISMLGLLLLLLLPGWQAWSSAQEKHPKTFPLSCMHHS